MDERHRYFPGLNAIRLFAAIAVILWHVDASSGWMILGGTTAVILFFVLSGFLISYLLLEEQEQTGTIDVRAFYIRRTLRIWPLYYLIAVLVCLSPALQPNREAMPYFFFFLGTWPHDNPRLDAGRLVHYWSISVEEVFYLVYPVLVKRAGVVRACLIILLLRVIMLVIIPHLDTETGRILSLYEVDGMAIGGLLAWAVYHQHSVLRALYSHRLTIPLMGIFILMNFRRIPIIPFFTPLVLGILIVNIATNPRFPKLENKLVSWWGQRSYGLYMWHYPIIGVLISTQWSLSPMAVLGLTLLCTFMLAAVSYRFFERPFLRLKSKFGQPHPAPPAHGFAG